MVLVTAIVFIVLLLLLVLVHEYGHFIVAKRAGCRVEEFGFGFPPRLFSWKRGETVYSFNALPIGGFVKIEGEDMQDMHPSPASFASKPARWRIAILAAGVVMNVVLAAVLLSVQAAIGFPTLVTGQAGRELTDLKTYITAVAPDSPAELSGLKPLDRIVAIQGNINPTIEHIQQIMKEGVGETVTVEVERQGRHQVISLSPRANPPLGQGAVGVQLAATGLTKVPWWQAPWLGIKRTGQLLVAIVVQFASIVWQLLVSRSADMVALTGPIGIAVYAHEATKLGVSYLLEFGALISLNLALINILPFPALDGGRIAFILFEKVRRGKRLPIRFEQITHAVGFAVLIALMLLITLKDIRRFF